MDKNIYGIVSSLTDLQIFWSPKSTGDYGPVSFKNQLVVYVTWIIYIEWHCIVSFNNRTFDLDLPSRSQLLSALCESYDHSKSEIKYEFISLQGILF